MLKWTVSKRTDVASDTVADSAYFAEPSTRHRRDRRRRSKENHDHHHHQHTHHKIETPHPLTMRQMIATSTPYGSQETLCLLVNSSSSLTTTLSPSPLRKRKQATTNGSNRAYASTLPTFGVEYSPMPRQRSGQSIALRGLTIPDSFFGSARYFPPSSSSASAAADGPPALKRRRIIANAIVDCPPPMPFNSNHSSSAALEVQRSQRMAEYVDEEADLNLSSKALDDVELGRMIDDILQSKRKPTTDHRQSVHQAPVTGSALSDEDFAFISHKPIRSTSCRRQECSPPQTVIPEHLYTEHPFLRESIDLLAGMSTPKDTRTVDDADSAQPALRPRTAASGANNERSPRPTVAAHTTSSTTAGTPVGPEQIRRCLTFAESPETMASWLEKRNSVASTMSTTSARSSTHMVSGTLNLSIRASSSEIEVHVIRCKDLVRAHGGPINAYVKVAKLAEGQSVPAAANNNRFQRTRVHRDSAEPFFNHRFIFDNPSTRPPDVFNERIQLTVWHRDRESKRSEFLGCLVFPVHTIIDSNAFGAFALQPQSCLDEASAATAVRPIDGAPTASSSAAARTSQLTEQVLRPPMPENDKPSSSQINDIMSYLDDLRDRNVEPTTFNHSLCVR